MRKDPYKEYRDKEHASINRMAIRTVPFMFCAYIFYGQLFIGVDEGAPSLGEIGKSFLVVLCFHIYIEIIYSSLKKDSTVFSLAVMIAWVWCIYQWWFVENVNFFQAFLPPLGIVLIVAKGISYVEWIRASKNDV